jgi:phenylacetate-CoA ligase
MNPRFPPDYDERSRRVLDEALAHVPAYREWRAFDPGPACSVAARYAALPALTKDAMRRHTPNGFLRPGRNAEAGLRNGEIEFVRTSGTTAEQATNLWHQPWWDDSERASWRLNAHAARVATGEHREAILSSALCVGILSSDGWLPMEERVRGRFLFLNEKVGPPDWTPDVMDRMADELGRFQPAVLEANPSFLATLSRHVVSTGRRAFQPGLIILTYEYPTRLQRAQIARAFRAPAASSYGSTEAGYVFMECEAGRYHQNAESCRVDFEPWKAEHGGPRRGRILVTPLAHPWTVLVRFHIGDAVRLEETGACPCGRDEGFLLAGLEGRICDTLLAPDGRAVTPAELDAALSPVEGMAAFQVEQAAPNEYLARLAAEGVASRQTARDATRALRALYGPDARIAVQFDPAIPIEPSGKYRLAKSRVPLDPDALLANKPLAAGASPNS